MPRCPPSCRNVNLCIENAMKDSRVWVSYERAAIGTGLLTCSVAVAICKSLNTAILRRCKLSFRVPLPEHRATKNAIQNVCQSEPGLADSTEAGHLLPIAYHAAGSHEAKGTLKLHTVILKWDCKSCLGLHLDRQILYPAFNLAGQEPLINPSLSEGHVRGSASCSSWIAQHDMIPR